MEYIVESLKWFTLSWVVITMTPSIIHTIKHRDLFKGGFYPCLKCLTFWLVLLCTQDVFIASTASFLAFITDNFLNITIIQDDE